MHKAIHFAERTWLISIGVPFLCLHRYSPLHLYINNVCSNCSIIVVFLVNTQLQLSDSGCDEGIEP